MLKGIDPRLNADVLHALRAMGHGDMVILVDTNFPAETVARQTVTGRVLRMDNLSAAEASAAILSVLPLDTFVDDFAARMEVVGDAENWPEVQREVQAQIIQQGESRELVGVERFAFYELAKQAFAVIQTGERRFYGCFMFRKGVIAPES